MTEYISMWKNYFNFTDRTTVKGYWLAVLINLIVGFIVGLIAGLLRLNFLAYLYTAAVFVPSLALMVRRLHDSGKQWYYLLLFFIPVVGQILLIVLFCLPSHSDDGVPVV